MRTTFVGRGIAIGLLLSLTAGCSTPDSVERLTRLTSQSITTVEEEAARFAKVSKQLEAGYLLSVAERIASNKSDAELEKSELEYYKATASGTQLKLFQALKAYKSPRFKRATSADVAALLAGRQETALDTEKTAAIKANLAKLLENKSFVDWAKLVGDIFETVKAEATSDAADAAAAAAATN